MKNVANLFLYNFNIYVPSEFALELELYEIQAQAFDEIEKSINKNGNDANLGEMADIMLADGNKDEAIRLGCKLCPIFKTSKNSNGTYIPEL